MKMSCLKMAKMQTQLSKRSLQPQLQPLKRNPSKLLVLRGMPNLLLQLRVEQKRLMPKLVLKKARVKKELLWKIMT
jgi:hypothetical protein